jgi:OOP family OmpA-OmpF porin
MLSNSLRIVGVIGLTTVFSACSTTSTMDPGAKMLLCAAAGGLAGAGITQAADTSDGESAVVAATGAIIGAWLCKSEPTPAPKPAPEPAAPPAKPAAPPPPPPPPPAEGTKIESLEGALFDFDKATLKPTAVEKLDHAVKVLNEFPSVKLSVEGHTDSVGSDKYNQGLSERRAKSVVDYLVKAGIDASRLTAVGYGKTRPVASNDTADGRAMNRRVDLVVSDN